MRPTRILLRSEGLGRWVDVISLAGVAITEVVVLVYKSKSEPERYEYHDATRTFLVPSAFLISFVPILRIGAHSLLCVKAR